MRRNQLDSFPQKAKIKYPLAHQVEAIEKGIAYYQKFDSGKLIMPCGSGKTLTALWISDALQAKTVIVVLPTLYLQSQALDTWIGEVEQDILSTHKVILIGSDKEIGSRHGIVTTTDTGEVANFIKSLKNSEPLLILTTYHSSKIIAEIAVKNKLEIDLCIFDEAHHTAGGEKISFQSLIKNPDIKISKKLFMTATPKILQGTVANDPDGLMQAVSMDDETIYGKEIYRLTTREAIKRKIICDYKIVTMNSNKESIFDKVLNNAIINDLGNKGINGESRMIALAISIIKATQILPMHHLIAFASTIERTKQFEIIIRSVSGIMGTNLSVFQIDNTHTDTERRKILKNYHDSKNAIIINARLLGEGFDMPAVDAVCFIDEKSSVVDIVQAVGRAWRPSPGKKFGYIILPLLTNELKSRYSEDITIFKRILSALATTDEIVYAYFNARVKKEDRGPLQIIHNESISESINTNELIDSITPSIWRNLNSLFGKKLGENKASISEVIAFITSLAAFGVDGPKKWLEYCRNPESFPGAPKKPINIPIHLWEAYSPNYRIELFFPRQIKEKQKTPLKVTFEFILKLQEYNVNSLSSWYQYCKQIPPFDSAPIKPEEIPVNLSKYYERFCFRHFFDHQIVKIEEATVFTRSLAEFGIVDLNTWVKYWRFPEAFSNAPRPPKGIPFNLRRIYRSNYMPYRFFGKVRYKSLEQTAEFTNSLYIYGVKTYKNWISYCTNKLDFPGAPDKPYDIPVYLRNIYKSEFIPSKFFKDSKDKGIKYASLPEAIQFTQSLGKFGVKNGADWHVYSKNNLLFPGAPEKPYNIPANLEGIYKGNFKSSVFFVNGVDSKIAYRTWEEAAKFTMSLSEYGVINGPKWSEYCKNPELFPGAPKKPKDIPVNLGQIYSKNYKAVYFFSNSIEPHKKYASPEEAAKFTQSLAQFGVTKQGQWYKYCRNPKAFPNAPIKPDNIPVYLEFHYKGIFKHEVFFSKGSGRREYATIEEVIAFTQSLGKYGITGRAKYELYAYHPEKFPGAPERPANMPASPWDVFKDKFNSRIFFSEGRRTYIDWADFDTAVKFVRSLEKFGVTNTERWLEYLTDPSKFPGAPTRPENIPAQLRKVYKGKYNFKIFFPLSTAQERPETWASKKEAKEFINSLGKFGVINQEKWYLYCKSPNLFPGAPAKPRSIPLFLKRVYKDFTHKEFFPLRHEWASYEEAKAFTRSLSEFGITGPAKYSEYCSDYKKFPGAPEKPTNIPRNLDRVYKEKYDKNDLFIMSKG